MDVLTDLLDGVRARGALFRQAVMSPPWGLRFAHGAPLTLVTMLRGEAWIVPAGSEAGEPVLLRPGDVAVARGPAPFTVADRPGTRPGYAVTDADYCSRADGTEAGEEIVRGVRSCQVPGTCGVRDPGAPALLLAGAYEGGAGRETGERLLRALPGLLVVPDDPGALRPLLDLIAAEVVRDRPGQRVVLDRFLDVLLVSVLRAWFDRAGADAPAWYGAMRDPVAGEALRLLHDEPSHPWTVAGLAAKVGVSRATLARRFADRVGEAPMTYLTGWRLALAADLLRETDATVGSIARRVGYANAFALSVAFKRLYGTTPSAHRASR
ncbi:AraC family transcriptional regulator [Actinomadura rugatobispora]|uniref:AraC family transcriptional regulator n=1 Tax=Actinomadura rugatobispora TaxID=1994 RepID=A0ABW1AF02_9ACTN|nr:AraC family transcriptional regulator [Actinomadura rugatobispora]